MNEIAGVIKAIAEALKIFRTEEVRRAFHKWCKEGKILYLLVLSSCFFSVFGLLVGTIMLFEMQAKNPGLLPRTMYEILITHIPTFTPFPTYTFYPTYTLYPTWTFYPTPSPTITLVPTWTPTVRTGLIQSPSYQGWLDALFQRCFSVEVFSQEPYRFAKGQKFQAPTFEKDGLLCYKIDDWGVSITDPYVVHIKRQTQHKPRGKMGLPIDIKKDYLKEGFSIKMRIFVKKFESYGENSEVDFILGIGDTPFQQSKPTNTFLIMRTIPNKQKVILCGLSWTLQRCEGDYVLRDARYNEFVFRAPQSFDIEIKPSRPPVREVIFVINGEPINPPQDAPTSLIFWIGYDIRVPYNQDDSKEGFDLDIYIDFRPSIQN